MRPLSRALTDLIACAEDIVLRPAVMPPTPSGSFAQLVAEITAHDDKPAENVRTTRVAMMMLLAIENAFAEPRRGLWQSTIGFLLKELRDEAYQALKNERESLLSEAAR